MTLVVVGGLCVRACVTVPTPQQRVTGRPGAVPLIPGNLSSGPQLSSKSIGRVGNRQANPDKSTCPVLWGYIQQILYTQAALVVDRTRLLFFFLNLFLFFIFSRSIGSLSLALLKYELRKSRD